MINGLVAIVHLAATTLSRPDVFTCFFALWFSVYECSTRVTHGLTGCWSSFHSWLTWFKFSLPFGTVRLGRSYFLMNLERARSQHVLFLTVKLFTLVKGNRWLGPLLQTALAFSGVLRHLLICSMRRSSTRRISRCQFRHMQIMSTSSAGEVLKPNNFCVNAGVGGTSMDGDGHEDRNIIGPGEKITYFPSFFLPQAYVLKWYPFTVFKGASRFYRGGGSLPKVFEMRFEGRSRKGTTVTWRWNWGISWEEIPMKWTVAVMKQRCNMHLIDC